MKRLVYIGLAFVGTALLFTGVPTAKADSGRVTGAIFTTVADGSAVNANIYDSKCSVYLDGGPGPHAPASAAGLADGDYFFQVTDPSGQQLLSTDPVSNRRFTVANGVIVAYVGTGGPTHATGLDSVNPPALGAITIQLANSSCPTDFLNTPNNGGTYKAWVTPVGAFDGNPSDVDNPCGGGCFHGFLPAQSKTDNFKAALGTTTFCLILQKQFLQDNGTYAPGAGWTFTVTDPLGGTNDYSTDTTGQVQVCGLTAGNYTVSESTATALVVGLVVNGAPVSPVASYSFTWAAGDPNTVILFQNELEIF
jgi:hypothetical protein